MLDLPSSMMWKTHPTLTVALGPYEAALLEATVYRNQNTVKMSLDVMACAPCLANWRVRRLPHCHPHRRGDKRPVGLGLPLAGANVQGVQVVDEQVEFLGGAFTTGVGPVERVRQGFMQAVQFRDVVRGLAQRHRGGADQGAVTVAGISGAGRPRVSK